ncbi:bifunctional 3'-5' exonuclease/DNA polymerase [Cryobacterium psychrophilum]|uniref:DNA-directed DNA polymerase n=1 Tax=Cryobacterium psychrophilum TaxID=41988 RepID=A0A4Y8KPM8_9MICO|nr:bifunctional 3'-5' exonuclease/DNA polymerase [Cryobacterium psychrophilum]TDW28439.1 DNA polymerase-1 [Cryobacterium psychrophilum]TFD75117.1 bifunctional 3'-5' exonuclease/DNA polymerase [Cryobacterium psychrophilum]
MYEVVSQSGGGGFVVATCDRSGHQSQPSRSLSTAEFLEYVARVEPAGPRWVWADTSALYPLLLEHGIRVRRCHDLRLCHVILRNSTLTLDSDLARQAPNRWDSAHRRDADHRAPGATATLFDLDETGSAGVSIQNDDVGEFVSQLTAMAGSCDPARLRLLLAAESVGALIAAEMTRAGLPWRTEVHDRLLTAELGPRVAYGVRPERLEELAVAIRTHLEDPHLNPDSPSDLLRALQRGGLAVTSTRAWTLQELDHPVIEPLLRYKKLYRLLSANGWSWMDTWIVNGRFHPEYVPGGVVTGRWAARGGGALQLPKQIRGAVVADEGWTFVVADAAQLEPRILAALSGDLVMAGAGRGTDLYAGIVANGVVDTRAHAKVAMLGAMYGATTGESGRLLPRLARAYPRAIGLTESAARAGERGEVVTTRLGRSSPTPGQPWHDAQAQAYDPGATSSDEKRARSQARDWGRFTRNFIVQGSAAEWALCWMAEVRKQLWLLCETDAGFDTAPHLVFFLHDEIIVHTPIALSARVAIVVNEAAATAGRLLFGDFPVDFMLTVATVDTYAEAK